MTEIYEAHPEVYHYTTKPGLKGILETQTLWGTHYTALNDPTEIRHMRQTLIGNLTPHMRELLEEFRKGSFKVKREISKRGGLAEVSKKEAESLVDVFYQVTFGHEKKDNDILSIPNAEPFITSFCSHDEADQYTRKNGLLSQWRAYGPVEGFAIVFDTKQLCDLNAREKDRYHYSSGSVGDVIYDDEENKIQEEFKELFEGLKSVHLDMLEDISDNLNQIYGPFVTSVSRFKHRAFHEEKEVRIISCPYTQRMVDKLNRTHPEIWKKEGPKKKIKQVHIRSDGKGSYIALFDLEKRVKLPIKRVILGPHREQDRLKSEVKAMVRGKRIKVHCSETPYRPPV